VIDYKYAFESSEGHVLKKACEEHVAKDIIEVLEMFNQRLWDPVVVMGD
jgi:hypothetical protein